MFFFKYDISTYYRASEERRIIKMDQGGRLLNKQYILIS